MSPRVLAALNGLVLVGALLVAGGVTGEPAPEQADAASPVAAPVPSAAPAVVPEVLGAPVQPAPIPAPATPAPTAAVASPAVPSPVVTTPAPPPRRTTLLSWRPYATVGPVVLHSPGEVVEAIGLHQSGHDGALPQSPVPSDVRIGRLDQRGRDTHVQGAADVVVDPEREVRSPVTGTVLRAGSYQLYCRHTDDYLVVEPDARPGWEVKLLHFEGLRVRPGQRVEAGVTVVGSGARVLPFRSQVDDHTAVPHWPHLHIEVVDASIPDRRGGGGC